MDIKQTKILLNNTWVKEDITREIRFELNENTTIQNLQNAPKILRKEFIALNAYVKKEERYKINHLNFHLRKLEKEEQIKPTGTNGYLQAKISK